MSSQIPLRLMESTASLGYAAADSSEHSAGTGSPILQRRRTADPVPTAPSSPQPFSTRSRKPTFEIPETPRRTSFSLRRVATTI
ncbi:hypothetical protein SERLADRAFT_389268, partial [Serpula lacrymans var. lacrymans S7.9]